MGYYFNDWAEELGFNMDFESENFQGREAVIKLCNEAIEKIEKYRDNEKHKGNEDKFTGMNELAWYAFEGIIFSIELE